MVYLNVHITLFAYYILNTNFKLGQSLNEQYNKLGDNSTPNPIKVFVYFTVDPRNSFHTTWNRSETDYADDFIGSTVFVH